MGSSDNPEKRSAVLLLALSSLHRLLFPGLQFQSGLVKIHNCEIISTFILELITLSHGLVILVNSSKAGSLGSSSIFLEGSHGN